MMTLQKQILIKKKAFGKVSAMGDRCLDGVLVDEEK
jgi:hypothetical protein